jgi:hypothetical protein
MANPLDDKFQRLASLLNWKRPKLRNRPSRMSQRSPRASILSAARVGRANTSQLVRGRGRYLRYLREESS